MDLYTILEIIAISLIIIGIILLIGFFSYLIIAGADLYTILELFLFLVSVLIIAVILTIFGFVCYIIISGIIIGLKKPDPNTDLPEDEKKSIEKWTAIGVEIVFLVIFIFVTGLGSYLYLNYISRKNERINNQTNNYPGITAPPWDGNYPLEYSNNVPVATDKFV